MGRDRKSSATGSNDMGWMTLLFACVRVQAGQLYLGSAVLRHRPMKRKEKPQKVPRIRSTEGNARL